MKQNLQTKLERYTKSISQQSIDPSKIKKLGLTSVAAMAAMVTVPVELNSQVVCGNQGAPTRTTLPCVDDLGGFGYTNYCAQFDFDGDGIDELQVRYYNYAGLYPMASMYVDPLTTQFWTVELSTYFGYANFPEYPTLRTDAYFPEVGDKLHIFPLSGGPGYGFIAFDGDAHPWMDGLPHPTTGQPICCYNSALPYMWGANSGMDLNDLVINAVSDVTDCIAPLPIILSKFEAKAKANSIALEWSTESEINNSGFAIERSTDGKEFIEIAFVNSQGESTKTVNYSFDDDGIKQGRPYYYRLRQIDYDGRFELSEIITAKIESDDLSFSLSPNPAYNFINVAFDVKPDEEVKASIYSINGVEIKSILPTSHGVGGDMQIDLSGVTDGIYFLKIVIGTRVSYKKFVVQR